MPSGATRLIETVLEAVLDQHGRGNPSMPDDYTGRVCAVLTDGKDTCGGTSKLNMLQCRVASYIAGGGQFLWLQSNLDAVAESQQIGGHMHQALQIGRTSQEMLGALRSLTLKRPDIVARVCVYQAQWMNGAIFISSLWTIPSIQPPIFPTRAHVKLSTLHSQKLTVTHH